MLVHMRRGSVIRTLQISLKGFPGERKEMREKFHLKRETEYKLLWAGNSGPLNGNESTKGA